MTTLPLDVLKKVALELDFEKLQDYCMTSQQYRQVCQDPYFWKARFQQDFPWAIGEDIDNRPASDYRGLYLYFRGIQKVDEGEDVERDDWTNEVYDLEHELEDDPDIQALESRISELQEELEKRKETIRRDITDKLTRGDQLKKEGFRLINNTFRTREPLHHDIPYDDVYPQWVDVLRTNHLEKSPRPLWETVGEFTYRDIEIDVRDGDTITLHGEQGPLTLRVIRAEDGALYTELI